MNWWTDDWGCMTPASVGNWSSTSSTVMDKETPDTVPLEPAHPESADLVALTEAAIGAYASAESAIRADDPALVLIATEHRLRKRSASRLVSRGEESATDKSDEAGTVEHWWSALKKLVSDPEIRALEHCEEADAALIKGIRQHLVAGVQDESLGRVLESEFERLKSHLSRLTQERAFRKIEHQVTTPR